MGTLFAILVCIWIASLALQGFSWMVNLIEFGISGCFTIGFIILIIVLLIL